MSNGQNNDKQVKEGDVLIVKCTFPWYVDGVGQWRWINPGDIFMVINNPHPRCGSHHDLIAVDILTDFGVINWAGQLVTFFGFFRKASGNETHG